MYVPGCIFNIICLLGDTNLKGLLVALHVATFLPPMYVRIFQIGFTNN